MEMEDPLASAPPDVDEHPVILQPGPACRVGDEVEHSLRLLGRESLDVSEGVDVPFGQDEQVRLGLRVDVADRDEAVALGDVVALADQPAKEAVVRQRGSPRR